MDLEEKGGTSRWVLCCVFILKPLRPVVMKPKAQKPPGFNIKYVCVLPTHWRPIYTHRNIHTAAATTTLRVLIGWSFKCSLSVFCEVDPGFLNISINFRLQRALRHLNATRRCTKVAMNVHRFTHCMLAGHLSRSNKPTPSYSRQLLRVIERKPSWKQRQIVDSARRLVSTPACS